MKNDDHFNWFWIKSMELYWDIICVSTELKLYKKKKRNNPAFEGSKWLISLLKCNENSMIRNDFFSWSSYQPKKEQTTFATLMHGLAHRCNFPSFF